MCVSDSLREVVLCWLFRVSFGGPRRAAGGGRWQLGLVELGRWHRRLDLGSMAMRCRAYLQFARGKLSNVRSRVAQQSDIVLSRLWVSTRPLNLADVAGNTVLGAVPLWHQDAYEITDLELFPRLEPPADYSWQSFGRVRRGASIILESLCHGPLRPRREVLPPRPAPPLAPPGCYGVLPTAGSGTRKSGDALQAGGGALEFDRVYSTCACGGVCA